MQDATLLCRKQVWTKVTRVKSLTSEKEDALTCTSSRSDRMDDAVVSSSSFKPSAVAKVGDGPPEPAVCLPVLLGLFASLMAAAVIGCPLGTGCVCTWTGLEACTAREEDVEGGELKITTLVPCSVVAYHLYNIQAVVGSRVEPENSLL